MKILEFDDLVLNHILNYQSLYDIYKFSLFPLNHRLKRMCNEIIFHYKINNVIYKKILKQKKSNVEINDLKLVFFKLKNFRDNFKSFRYFIFYVFNKLNCVDFALITRMDKFCYVKKIDNNRAILLFYYEKANIYYSLFYKESLNETSNIPDNIKNNSGYIYYNNNLIMENADIIKYI